MVIREVQDRDFVQLAEMRWTHAVEDDETYGEHNTDGVTKSVFIEEFVAFLYTNKEYKIFKFINIQFCRHQGSSILINPE